MEKQGIITGIGNEITPEIDAILNDFIVGENAIIKGLNWVGNVLNAGTCQLCGYRGVLDKSQEIKDTYVYGKFIINFDKDIEDEFYIETSSIARTKNVNPTSITVAGTYYLELYVNKETTLPAYKYPKQAHISDKANHLLAGGIIDSTATTETAPLNDNSKRVANTKYVHNQIVAEIDEGKTSISFSYGTGTITLKRRSRYVIGTVSYSYIPAPIPINQVIATLPKGYLPRYNVNVILGGLYAELQTNGNIVNKRLDEIWYDYEGQTITFGYEC